MPNVSTLTIRLSANSAQLVKEFARTQRRARTFSQRVKGSLGLVGTVFRRISAAGVLALTGLSAAGIAAADSLAKTSAKLGIAANELAGLRFAAEQTGVGVKALDLGLQRMVRRVAEAAQGSGEAQAAIKELGLEASELAKLSPDEQFRTLADAFENVGTQSDKVRLGFKLFDSEGVALVNTLAAGREELARYTAEAKRFGLALTGRQLKNVQDAADSQNRVGKAFSGLGRQLGATFAPAMEAASNATANLVSSLTESIPKLTAVAAGIFGINREVSRLTASEITAEMQNVIRLTGEAVDARDRAQAKLNSGTDGGFIPGRQASQAFEAASKDVEQLQARYVELRDALAELNAEADQTVTTFTDLGSAQVVSDANRARVKALAERWAEVKKSLLDYIAEQDRLRASATQIFNSTRTPLENWIAKMKEARDLLAGDFIDQDTFDRYNRALSEGLVKPLDKVSEKANELRLNFESAFEDAAISGGSFRKVLQGILQDLARIAIRRTITEPIGNAFSSFIASALSPKALGGATTAGTPYLVGERGPEIFQPNVSGRIIPNNKLGRGGDVNHYHFEAGADVATIRREIIPMLESTRRAAVGDVFEHDRLGNLGNSQ